MRYILPLILLLGLAGTASAERYEAYKARGTHPVAQPWGVYNGPVCDNATVQRMLKSDLLITIEGDKFSVNGTKYDPYLWDENFAWFWYQSDDGGITYAFKLYRNGRKLFGIWSLTVWGNDGYCRTKVAIHGEKF